MKHLRLIHLYKGPLRSGSYCFLLCLLALALSACQDLIGSGKAILNPPQASASASVPPADAGLLLLLVPDGQAMTHPLVTAWIDAGSELEFRIQAVTDQQFRAMGLNALKYAGLILPDRLHVVTDDVLMKLIRDYTQAGGQTLLVHDFGTLTLDGNLKPT